MASAREIQFLSELAGGTQQASDAAVDAVEERGGGDRHYRLVPMLADGIAHGAEPRAQRQQRKHVGDEAIERQGLDPEAAGTAGGAENAAR